jgi:hypothetical protein
VYPSFLLFIFAVPKTKSNMKQKFLLSLVFVCTMIVSAKAQISKGSVWLGGSIGFSLTENEYENSTTESKTRTYSVLPAVGIAVKDNLIVGIGLSHTNKKTENFGYTKTGKEKTYGGGVFIRQYVPIINKLYIFGEASAAFRSFEANEELTYNSPPLKTNTKGWDGSLALTPGLALGINKKIQLETGFNSLFSAVYSKRTTDFNEQSPDVTQKNFSTGIALDNESLFYIGVRFLISKG